MFIKDTCTCVCAAVGGYKCAFGKYERVGMG